MSKGMEPDPVPHPRRSAGRFQHPAHEVRLFDTPSPLRREHEILVGRPSLLPKFPEGARHLLRETNSAGLLVLRPPDSASVVPATDKKPSLSKVEIAVPKLDR